MRRLTGVSLIIGLIAIHVGSADAQRTAFAAYAIVDIGTLGGDSSEASGLNNFGDVVGMAATADGARHAFLYRNFSVLDLGTLPGGTASYATAINDRGDVVGSSGINAYGPQFREFSQGFIWQNGTMRAVGALYCPCSFNVRYGTSQAFAVSDTGWVVGDSQTNRPALRGAFVWDESDIHSLDVNAAGPGDAHAYGISDIGEIVGDANGRAFLVRDGASQDLGVLPGYATTTARAINNKGQVVGSAANVAGSTRGFLWDLGTMRDLAPMLGDAASQANAINVGGDSVGRSGDADFSRSRAVLWRNGLTIDLTRLIAAPGWMLLTATGINDLGQIAGIGLHDGRTRAFLLTPQ